MRLLTYFMVSIKQRCNRHSNSTKEDFFSSCMLTWIILNSQCVLYLSGKRGACLKHSQPKIPWKGSFLLVQNVLSWIFYCVLIERWLWAIKGWLHPHWNYWRLSGERIRDGVFTDRMICICEPIRAGVFLMKVLISEYFLPIIFFLLFLCLSGQLQVTEITIDVKFLMNSKIFPQNSAHTFMH